MLRLRLGNDVEVRMHDARFDRRRVLCRLAAATAWLSAPALASSRRAMARMTDGPFYPPRSWRERWPDWDADLTRVQQAGSGRVAHGEHLGLEGRVIDGNERAIDGATIEIWQCDA